jgi:hypothetical protein
MAERKKKQRNPNAASAKKKAEGEARELMLKAHDLFYKEGKTFRQVAEEIGRSVSTAHKYIDKVRQSILGECVDIASMHLEREDDRLGRLLQDLMGILYWPDAGTPRVVETETRLAVTDQIRKMSESLRKLWGVDRPAALQESVDRAALDIMMQLGTPEEINEIGETGTSPCQALHRVAALIGQRRRAMERKAEGEADGAGE